VELAVDNVFGCEDKTVFLLQDELRLLLDVLIDGPQVLVREVQRDHRELLLVKHVFDVLYVGV